MGRKEELQTQIYYRLIEKLTASEARYRELVERLYDVVFRCDNEGSLLFINPAWTTFLGHSTDGSLGRPISEHILEADRPKWASLFGERRNPSRNPGQNLEIRLIDAEGNPRWVEVSIQSNEEGEVVGLFHSIDERKRAESERESLIQELAAKNSRLQEAATERKHLLHRITMATDCGGVGIWEWHVPGNSLVWDKRMHELYGVAQDSNEPPYETWSNSIHEDDRARAEAELRAAADDLSLFDTTFRIVTAGETRHIRAFGRVVEASDSGPVRMIGANWDVSSEVEAASRLERLNQRLERSNLELEQANKDVREFAYIVSHDLRAPLVNVLGFTEELRHGTRDLRELLDERVEELSAETRVELDRILDDIHSALAFIGSGVDNMDSRINSVLQLARLGRRELKPESLALNEVVDSILAVHQYAFSRDAGIAEIGELPRIESDRGAVEQILDNLIGNAAKFRESGRPLRLKIWADSDANGTTLHVEDNGRGIDDDDRGRIFDIFRRVGKQDTQGEGMGLAYAQALVRRLGGRLTCESELGKGTTFSVFLPAKETSLMYA